VASGDPLCVYSSVVASPAETLTHLWRYPIILSLDAISSKFTLDKTSIVHSTHNMSDKSNADSTKATQQETRTASLVSRFSEAGLSNANVEELKSLSMLDRATSMSRARTDEQRTAASERQDKIDRVLAALGGKDGGEFIRLGKADPEKLRTELKTNPDNFSGFKSVDSGVLDEFIDLFPMKPDAQSKDEEKKSA
jgi:hypothetical protein